MFPWIMFLIHFGSSLSQNKRMRNETGKILLLREDSRRLIENCWYGGWWWAAPTPSTGAPLAASRASGGRMRGAY